MVTTLPKTVNNDKPWHRYRHEPNWKVLEPGWGGQLDDRELEFILSKLQTDETLSYWWGFRPKTKRRPVEAIKAVAMSGDPAVRSHSVKLVRPHQHPIAAQMAFPWA